MLRFLLYLFASWIIADATIVAVDYEQEIRPILNEHCLDCHGPDKQKSDLRIDKRAILIKGGNSGLASITPGKPKKSHLVDLLVSTDSDERMPPKGVPLSKEQIRLIETWISEGAPWPGQMNDVVKLTTQHWSFQPVQRPPLPTKDSHPIDAFLFDKLNANKIAANQHADPLALLRRASIILTGLPPSPEKVQSFLDAYAMNASSAYEELVDQLMDSLHFGERWAQHWLDVIRWAESNGSEANLYRKNAWLYRDYVVRAFNEDIPYNQFIQEQIAGDSLGAGDATGFLVAGPHVPAATVGREPTAIRQARADRMDEIMQTIGASVMGVTLNCARCHSHKFDPISLKDYYAMSGIFQDVEFGSRFPELSPNHPRKKQGDALMKEINTERELLREKGGWEENWGAYRELHFPPTKTQAIRIRFKMRNLGLDELEIFGPEAPLRNIAAKRQGTKLSGYPEEGTDGRNPIHRIHDGEYGTMAWRTNIPKDSDERPWVIMEFEKPHTINRLQLSANREYFYDTDYLTQKPFLPRYEFDVDIRKNDGSWQSWTGTSQVNKKLIEQHAERETIIKSIHDKIDLLFEQGPRPSFVGRFIQPDTTYVLHRGSPENKRDEVVPAGFHNTRGNGLFRPKPI
jgi:mono/diheme cytochrome c family protein